MSDHDYITWQELQREAAAAVSLAEKKRAAGNGAEWGIFFARAIALQELASNFARCHNI